MVERYDDQAVAAMGLSPIRLQHAWNVIRTEIEKQTTPSVVAMVTRGGYRIRFAAGSTFPSHNSPTDAAFDTIYDCASLTKVVVTLPLVLMLIDQGKVRLRDPVALFLPEFGVQNKAGVTVGQLLTHTAGLAPFYDMHSHGWDRDKIISFIYECSLQYEPGSRVVYSDLGYILLGEIASKVMGMSLDQAAVTYLFKPLHMIDSSFSLSSELKARIAPTEMDSTAGTYLHGIVHDENARALGGICGHAGLFSTAEDLIRYTELWLNGGKLDGQFILSQAIVDAAAGSHTKHIAIGSRGLGWALKGDPYDASGDLLSSGTYGHTGFTGTSLYVDPLNQLGIVILTNRVHYGRVTSVARLRDCFHNAIAAAID
jgi:serine-type D-Ala-D-Ala carboxypeptidase